MDSSLDDLDFDTFLSLHRSPIKRTDTTDREAIESASQRIARRREERKKAELEAIRAAAIERNKRDDAERLHDEPRHRERDGGGDQPLVAAASAVRKDGERHP